MQIYGKQFAPLWDKHWSFWNEEIWPFLHRTASKQAPHAREWLDLCCGTGGLLKRICDAGYAATGMDISPHQLERARSNAPAARLICADIREFAPAEKADVITCLFDSLNYLTEPVELEKVFQNVRDWLNKGGVFMFDMLTPFGFRNAWLEPSTVRESDQIVIIEPDFDEDQNIGHCRITGFTREGELWRRYDEEHVERAYTSKEIERCLFVAGFEFKAFDAYHRLKPGKRSERLLYLCR
ncbi:MAG: class I SAM-dependent methyltransferase [Candidatus Sumerlaeota bacterium]|nr:class I SAM-dependent methyltransferase [Candidatus Sumerlaeota bacterium]